MATTQNIECATAKALSRLLRITLVAASLALAACAPEPLESSDPHESLPEVEAARPAPRGCGFKEGEFVVAKLDGRRGMILYGPEYAPEIVVRFAAPEIQVPQKNGRLEIAPYSSQRMNCYEVEAEVARDSASDRRMSQ